MKVGFSLGRCVKDIHSGKVNYNDVLVIISNTSFDPNKQDHWNGLWSGYSTISTYWAEFSDQETEIKKLCLRLFNEGKLHQPRKFGNPPHRNYPTWLNVCLTDDDHERNPSAKLAYEKYKTLAGLL